MTKLLKIKSLKQNTNFSMWSTISSTLAKRLVSVYNSTINSSSSRLPTFFVTLMMSLSITAIVVSTYDIVTLRNSNDKLCERFKCSHCFLFGTWVIRALSCKQTTLSLINYCCFLVELKFCWRLSDLLIVREKRLNLIQQHCRSHMFSIRAINRAFV